MEGSSQVKHFSAGGIGGELLSWVSTGALEGAGAALALLSTRNGTGFQPPVETSGSGSGWSAGCSGPVSGFRSEDFASVFTASQPVSPASFPSLSGEVGSILRSVSWRSRSGEPLFGPPSPPFAGEGLVSHDCLSPETDLDFDLFLWGELEIERLFLLGDFERLPLRLGDLDFER